MPKLKSKKSETLEVRVSYNVKNALQQKARLEKKTVSEIVRQLIAQYLTIKPRSILLSNESSVYPTSFMHRLSQLARRPRAITATVLGLVGAALIFQSPSIAQDVSLELDGTFVIDDVGIHSFSEKVDLSFGQEHEFVIGSDANYQITMMVQEVDIEYGDVQIEFKINRLDDTGDVMIAQPSLTMDFARNARIELTGEDGGFYGMTARIKSTAQ